jgi:predicted lipase
MSLSILEILLKTQQKYCDFFLHNGKTGVQIQFFEKKDNLILKFHVDSDTLIDCILYSTFQWKSKIVTQSVSSLRLDRYNVHDGFQKETDSIMIPLFAFFVKHSPVLWKNRIHFVGHGRAGALATLAGSRVASLYPDDEIHVITTGSPRIGDQSFGEWYERTRNIFIDRIVIDDDVIPHFPRFRGYKHVGTKRKLKGKRSMWYTLSTYIALLKKQYMELMLDLDRF